MITFAGNVAPGTYTGFYGTLSTCADSGTGTVTISVLAPDGGS